MPTTEQTFNAYVKLSIDSGVAPLELSFYPIVSCDSGLPVAYRTETVIHSITLGNLTEPEYTYVSDPLPLGVEILKHSLQHMISASSEFASAGRNVMFLSVRCPSEIVENTDTSLYEIISAVLKNNPSLDPSSLCIEFPASLLEQNTEKAKTAILDLKLLKVRTALVGCGKEDFPISKLVTVQPDIVILDPSATAWAGSRDKPQLLSSLISYIQSMGAKVIAEGSEEQRYAMRNSDCIGFIVSGSEPLSLTDAIAQKEESE